MEKLTFHAPYHLDVFGDTTVSLSPEAKEIIKYKDELSGYKITPKGMLQIYLLNLLR
mgnify:CR=1 FL=1